MNNWQIWKATLDYKHGETAGQAEKQRLVRECGPHLEATTDPGTETRNPPTDEDWRWPAGVLSLWGEWGHREIPEN